MWNSKFYDTLASPAPFESRIIVPAITLTARCGEVPRSTWTVDVTPVGDTINLTISAALNQRTKSE
jgi:hypothetical protein